MFILLLKILDVEKYEYSEIKKYRESQKALQSKKNTEGLKEKKDHTFFLKVSDELVRIQKNLNLMDKKTKGLKQLAASVTRIYDNLSSEGYVIVKMLGNSYDDGMKLTANFVPDEDLEKGQQIITRIIKPQVNYQDVMIQSAQIEVSIGE